LEVKFVQGASLLQEVGGAGAFLRYSTFICSQVARDIAFCNPNLAFFAVTDVPR
jgi:hypothetical protein